MNEYIQADSNVESNCFLKDFTIITVRCVEEIFPTAMVFMDVSAEVYNNNNTSVPSVYYSILFSGNVLKGFSDLNLIFAGEISEKELHEDKIPELFGLPDITCDTLEEESQKIHRILCAIIKKDPEHKYWFDPVKVKEKYKLKMWPAELNNGILGQIRFTPSRADIYDIRDMSKCFLNEPIPENSILINSDYYKEHSKRYDDIIVAAHELVHWNLHRMYFYISQLLDDNYQLMNCSSKPIVFDDSMSLKDRAYWYAEWQANELAIRVAMPKHLVEKAIEEYNNDESVHNPTDKPFSGMYYHHMIEKLSWDFNVPEVKVKERLRQLGYDYADGTFYTVDVSKYQPFTFTQGTLKENETFVIDRESYERLLRENKDFAELINSGRYIYLGYVVCLVDQKYVDVIINEDGLGFHLTTYAREHADECCIKFAVKSVYNECEKYINYGQTYLSSNKNELLQEYEACISDDLKETINSFAKEDSRLNSTLPYGDALAYYLFEDNKETAVQVKGKNGDFSYAANRIIDDFAERTSLSRTMIKNYLNNCSPPKLKTAMQICHKLGLNETQSREMLKSAGHYIDAPLPENKVCRLIFRLSYTQAANILENWEECVKHFKETTSESTSLSKL